MKRVLLKSLFLSFAVTGILACGGGTNPPPGANGCLPGQNCNLPAGAVVKYQGTLFNVNQGIAGTIQKTMNGSLWSPATNIESGSLNITAQGMPNGGTNYFVEMSLIPRNKSPFWDFCISISGPCNQPILINGNASYFALENGGHMLQLKYGGWTFNIVTNTGSTDNAFNGTQTSLSNVNVNFVNVGQDPTQGQLMANSSLNKFEYGPYGTPYGAPYNYNYNPSPWGGGGYQQPPYNPYGYRPY